MLFVLRSLLLIMLGFEVSLHATAASVPEHVLQILAAGKSVNLLVEYDDSTIQATATTMRKSKHMEFDDADILGYKSQKYQAFKDKTDQLAGTADIENLKEYSHLPLRFKRFNSLVGLNRLIARPGVKAVYEDVRLYPVLTSSLPLINQPAVASAGEQGNGTTVAVFDTGIDITNSAFGGCTAVNTPSTTCRVIVSNNVAASPATDHSHGTNVSAIVLGVAPQSKIAMLNVFDNTGGASASDVLTALNWAITNKSAYNIVAVNMSLGDTSNNATTCSTFTLNGWASSSITQAKNVGISVAIAAGNSAYTAGLASPACSPDAISVGAVYDSNVGGVSAGVCTDNTTAPDQIACFSNRSNYMTLFAPGAFVTAGGITDTGTSQAAPHVAGAIAVLRSTFPSETLAQTLARLTSTGAPISFISNSTTVTKPRVNLLEAARPANNNFATAVTVTGSSGAKTGLSLLANKEAGEPNHAGNAGGASVWWKWVAPAAGQVSLDSHGSNFDTLLAVYKGSVVSALTTVASNDNDGTAGSSVSGLLFQSVANQTYYFAVDGANGASGIPALNWSLNTTAKANLAISITGPSSIDLGANNTYTMTVSNAGPQSATNIVATATLPSGASYVSGDSACSASANVVTCRLASLAAGSNSALNFQVLWNSFTTGATLAASVSSDVPDSTTTDNTGNLQLVLAPSGNGEAPLPFWAMLLMGLGLLGASAAIRGAAIRKYSEKKHR
jgi:uncharacterized repeat protein (TIGR01451 family)